MFFTPDSPRGSFVVHFTNDPASDFGIWARGYQEAAGRLTESLLAEPGISDNEAYPVVFLYRHALELYLKGAVLKANRLAGLMGQAELCERLKFDHRLVPLYEATKRLLEASFPDDPHLRKSMEKLGHIVRDLDAVDPGSFNFRYPVNKANERPAEGPAVLGLEVLRTQMTEVLEVLDNVDTALGVEVGVATDVLADLYHHGQ